MTAKSWAEVETKVMELERENAELKERVETLERIGHELNQLAKSAIERHGAIIDKNERMEQALERACEWMDDYIDDKLDCEYCPLHGNKCIDYKFSKDNGCKRALIRHFKEGQDNG